MDCVEIKKNPLKCYLCKAKLRPDYALKHESTWKFQDETEWRKHMNVQHNHAIAPR